MRKGRKRVLALTLSMVFAASTIMPYGNQFVHAKSKEPKVIMIDNTAKYPYLDTSLSFEERAADLVSRMTLEEKQSQLKARTAAAIPRLGVRAYDWWSEALHGVARSGEATSFPTGLGIASTWNRELTNEMMSATSDEARAYTNKKGKGLSYWSPTINMARDPRWGRAEETFGEDPYLTAQIAENFINGLQGADDNTKYLKAIATVKHFAANNSEYNRHSGDAQMDERTLREYYTPAFKDSVENANVQSLMASYNRVNGTPMAANKYMLDTMLRRTWGFDGYVTTDCWALDDFWKDHKWIPEGWDHVVTPTETTALAIQAGTDLNCGDVYASQAINAVNEGILSEDDIDVALTRLFTARMRTGEFDNPKDVPYTSEEYSWENQISAEDHTKIAEQSSDEAVVMLKNDNVKGTEKKLLPLDKESTDKIVIVGDLADDVILGDYSGSPKEENKSTPVQGLQNLLGKEKVTYIQAGADTINGNYNFNINNFKLLDKDGKELKALLPKDNSELSNCQVENGGNLGYTKHNGYIAFKGVDMTGVGRISSDIAAPAQEARGGSIELHLNSPEGELVGTIKAEATNGWQEYKTCVTNYKDGGFEGKQDLYFVFKDPVSNAELSEEDIKNIREADAVVAYVGTTEHDSAEDRDRSTLALPRNQADLVNQIAEINPKTVAYIQAVGQVDVEEFKENVPAIFWCTYNGQAQGNAMARLLFGEANPSGKLTFTWYQDEKELPHIGDYGIRPNEESKGRTYQYFTGKVSYPFGHGLSYSSFAYSNLKVDKTSVTPNDTITVTADVKNTSNTDGKEVVELYIVSPEHEKNARPVKKLRGFEKVKIAAGETKTVTMEVPVSELYYWDESKAAETFDQGTYKIQVGTSSEDIKLEKEFNLKGNRKVELQTVTAIPDKTTLDMEYPENKATTKLSAAMNDQSFYNLEDAKVHYSSSNPDVAEVDDKGTVTPVGGGTALITAQVTVNGVSKTSSYPVTVKQEVCANDILVNGKSLTGFKPNSEKYQYVAESEEVPEVTAVIPDGLTAKITQADKIPGIATVEVQGGNLTRTYVIEFITESMELPSDTDFTKISNKDQLKEAGWEIIRDTDSDYEFTDKGLLIKSLKGDLYQNSNTAKNIFVKEAPGDWIVETHFTTDVEPNKTYQQAGMLIYGSDDDYVKLCHIKNNASKPGEIQYGKEDTGAWTDKVRNEISGKELYLRIQKQGNVYTGYYSADGGKTYENAGSVEVNLENPKVALFAMNGEQTDSSISATYSDVSFKKLPAECTCDLYNLELVEGKEVTYEEATGDGKELKAQAMKRGGCQVEGHQDAEIQYTYALAENGENTANATIDGNLFKSSQAGNAELKLTATWNGITIEAPESVTVLPENLTSYRQELENAIMYAETEIVPKKDTYTEESFATYEGILNEAREVLANKDATKEMLIDATRKLQDAEKNVLKKKEDGGEDLSAYKKALEDAIKYAKEEIVPKKDTYTKESFKEYEAILKDAEKVLANKDATKEMLIDATRKLQDAEKNVLKKKEDGGEDLSAYKKALEDAIKYAKEEIVPKKDTYTKESFKEYEAILKDAEKVLANKDATKEMLTNAVKSLKDAEKALVRKTSGNNGNKPLKPNKPGNGAVKTGDENTVMPFAVAGTLSAAAAIIVFVKRRKGTIK